MTPLNHMDNIQALVHFTPYILDHMWSHQRKHIRNAQCEFLMRLYGGLYICFRMYGVTWTTIWICPCYQGKSHRTLQFVLKK